MSRRRLASALVLSMVAALVAAGVGAVPAGAQALVQQPVPGTQVLWGVHCRSDGTCIGVGTRPLSGAATVVLSATGAVGPVRRVRAADRLADIACLPSGACLAVGSGYGSAVVAEIAGDGTPMTVRPVSGATLLTGIACPTATTCLATGERVTTLSTFPYNITVPVFVVITNGEPAPAQRYPRGSYSIRDVACPTTTRCLGVGDGWLAVFTASGGAWTVTTSVILLEDPEDYPTDAISCGSSTMCHATAVDFRQAGGGLTSVPAVMPVSADGVAGPIQPLSDRRGGAHGISCVGEGTCTVVGRDGLSERAMVVDVRPGQPPAVTLGDSSTNFYAVSCISVTACGIVGTAGGPPVGAFAWRS